MTMSDSAMSFINYQLAQSNKHCAYVNYSYAGVQLELATIKERAAELQSQVWASVAKGKLINKCAEPTDRELMLMRWIAEYIACGRTD